MEAVSPLGLVQQNFVAERLAVKLSRAGNVGAYGRAFALRVLLDECPRARQPEIRRKLLAALQQLGTLAGRRILGQIGRRQSLAEQTQNLTGSMSCCCWSLSSQGDRASSWVEKLAFSVEAIRMLVGEIQARLEVRVLMGQPRQVVDYNIPELHYGHPLAMQPRLQGPTGTGEGDRPRQAVLCDGEGGTVMSIVSSALPSVPPVSI